MKRRLWKTIPAVVLLATAAMASAQVRVFIDNERVWFGDVDAYISQGRVFVPLRGVFEEMGASVDYYAPTRRIQARRNGTDISLTLDSKTAYIDGMATMMDVAPHSFRGRTMVPLRFVSEALGADVQWDMSAEAVYISDTTSTSTSVAGNTAAITIPVDTVIPAKMDRQLSSNMSREGDPFTATINTRENVDYLGLPMGTKIHGFVSKATPRSGDEPGVLGLEFTRIVLPDGRTATVNGALTGLDSKFVTDEGGRLVAKNEHRNDTLTYVGIGAGAGVLIALLTDSDDWLRNGLIGAGLGWLYSEIQRNNSQPRDVVLGMGSDIGVRLDSSLVVR